MPAGSISSHGPPSYSRFFTLSILLIFSIFLRPVSAGPRNYTIDDQLGDEITSHIPTYAPTFAWATQDCQGCGVDPDKNQLFDGTATSATFMPDKNISSNTVDFDFNGTAIYIFFTLFYNEGNGVTVNTECNFTVDSEPAVFFNHTGDPTKPANQVRDYKALVFSRTGLTLESHHMKISMSDVSYHVFLSFDYAMYT
ncbi:hypothetical protein P691DRAFT_670592 [Macrolepiota fuliginosa MF-IS2]|uniref:Uncharacterized protein n=1 Tax=Macrolepiota fuliginosa MF-IS2 TaxID=1400762 RepID=A0A9P6C1K1_9AGAR|nr:hypothetical protein P691DRAFT_670592 [Macrolepiota fuliginosa MF-IS2]